MIKQLLFLSLYLSISAAYGQNNVTLDSLTFRHEKSGKEVQIKKGTTLEIITNNKQKFTGDFDLYSSNKLGLNVKKEVKEIVLSDIKRIIVYKDVSRDPVTSTLRFVVGASATTSLILGGAAAVGGATTVSDNTALGVGLMTVSVPLFYYSIKLFKTLKNAERAVIKPNNDWTISELN